MKLSKKQCEQLAFAFACCRPSEGDMREWGKARRRQWTFTVNRFARWLERDSHFDAKRFRQACKQPTVVVTYE